MTTAFFTYELQIGDVWNGKRIIQINPPPVKPLEWSYMIIFSDNSAVSALAQAQWEITRTVERIMI